MKISITDIDETFNILSSIDKEAAKKVIPKTAKTLFKNIQFYAKPHAKTGNMYKNIIYKLSNSNLSAIVGIEDNNMLVDWKGKKVNYAAFVLFGTRAHIIAPRKKRALRWVSLDEFIFAKVVKHPGYKGDNFIKKAVDKTLKEIDRWI